MGYSRRGDRLLQVIREELTKEIDYVDLREIELEEVFCSEREPKLFYNAQGELARDFFVYPCGVRRLLTKLKRPKVENKLIEAKAQDRLLHIICRHPLFQNIGNQCPNRI